MTVSSSRSSLSRLNRFDRQLWNRFVAIAQPYWFPMTPNGGKTFFGLIALLILWLLGCLFVVVSAILLLFNQFFPQTTKDTTRNLVPLIQSIIGSPSILFVVAALVIPSIVFFLLRDKLSDRWRQWSFLALVLLLSLCVSGMNVVISYVANYFTTALSERDVPTFWRFFFVYAGVFAIATPFTVYSTFFQELLGLRWRDWMSGKFMNQYLENRAFYEINYESDIDNPDQRISEDIKSFTETSLDFLLLLLRSGISLVAFTGILWSISPGLAAFLLVYASVGTLVTTSLGRKLISLNFNQLRREADFRYGLVHVRDNAESIAFYQGEERERGQLQRRFVEVLNNFRSLIAWKRNIGFFRWPYQYISYIIPAAILAPMYFAEQIQFGDITQAEFAFARVWEAVSLVVLQINALSAFAAGVNRLETFTTVLEQDTVRPEGLTTIDMSEDSQLALRHVSLQTPKGQQMLMRDLSVALQPQQSLVIVGHSGVGKSSLLRAIAGLWNTGTGQIIRPHLSEMLFLPQRPYMVLGTLRDQLLYPNLDKETTEATLCEALGHVNLTDLPGRVGGFDVELDWADVLSLGEQQRLAFARLLLGRPRYAVLDEATSALDLDNEKRLYQQLRQMGITYVSVGHRASLLKYHDFVLELSSDQGWKLTPMQEYEVNTEAFA